MLYFLKSENDGRETKEEKLIWALFNYKVRKANYIYIFDSHTN